MSNTTNQSGPTIQTTGFGTLPTIVAELKRIAETCVDVVVDARHIRFGAGEGAVTVEAGTPVAGEWITERQTMTKNALSQAGAKSEPSCPGGYLAKLADSHPEIAEEILSKTLSGTFLVRMLDGNVRAWLSDKFRILDNYPLAFEALKAIQSVGGDVVKVSLTPNQFRLVATTSSLASEIVETARTHRGGAHEFYKPGSGGSARLRATAGLDLSKYDATKFYPAVTISNSETGSGGLNVDIGIFESWCVNVATVTRTLRQIHIGKPIETGIYSRETVEADSRAIMMKARDAIRAGFDEKVFAGIADQVNGAAKDTIDDPTGAVANVVRAHSLTEEDEKKVLEYFLKDFGGANRYGLSRAVSRYAQDAADADREAELEAISGRLIAAGV